MNNPRTHAVEVDMSRIKMFEEMAVPAWVRGVWQRDSVRTDGSESRALFVVWIQTPTLYADIRAPRAGNPEDAGATEEGFAGWLDVDGQICRWKRPIDLHPGPEDADQGAMFVDGMTMYETGVLGNYFEEYRRVDAAQQCFAASRGQFEVLDGSVKFASDGPLEILVAAGPHVIHARRDGASALRYGRHEQGRAGVTFEYAVGQTSLLSAGVGEWTVWTDDAQNREMLLGAASIEPG